MNINVPTKPNGRRQVPIDVGSELHEGVKAMILEDFQSGAISDIEMSPSKFIRDLILQYSRYREFCRTNGITPQSMGAIVSDQIEVFKLEMA